MQPIKYNCLHAGKLKIYNKVLFNNKDKLLFNLFAKREKENTTDLKTGAAPPDDVI